MIAVSGTISEYSRLKQEVLSCFDEMLAVENIRSSPCEELRHKILTNTFNLVVVGQFKRGKTSLINALLGADILPVSVVPLTSIVTIMTWGTVLTTKVFFKNGLEEEIEIESLADYVTEKGNPRNIKNVREVVVTYPSPYLKDGVRLIDTPGVGSIYEHNTDVAYQYLPNSDAALFLFSVDQPMSKAELDFLKDVKDYANKIFFLMNKIDYLRDPEILETMAFSKNGLQNALNTEVRIFPVSAKLALEGKVSGEDDTLEKSMLPLFAEALNAFLMDEKGKIFILSVTNNLLRIISQVQFESELEMKSLETPLDDLKMKIAAFEKKKQEILLEKQNFDILLNGETKRLVNNVLDENLAQFKQDLILAEIVHLEENLRLKMRLPAREFHDSAERVIIGRVEQAFTAWRAREDEHLSKAFESLCNRYVSIINDNVEKLLKFSSELFTVPFTNVKEEHWSAKSEFYYKFKNEPVGLEMAISALIRALPRFLGDKIIIKKMRNYLHHVIEMQSGRMRSDFADRLDKSKLDFQWEMHQKIDATIEGIGTAIENGINRRTQGEHEVQARKQTLLESCRKLGEIRNRVSGIREHLMDSGGS
jgi:GTPase SAR1 family protein